MFEHLVNPPEPAGLAGEPARLDFLQSGQEGEIVEVPLLLPVWQVSALERAALVRGLTAGQMVRQLLHEVLAPPSTRRKGPPPFPGP
jgi:hypothetical protein